jgi:hypothetical protein
VALVAVVAEALSVERGLLGKDLRAVLLIQATAAVAEAALVPQVLTGIFMLAARAAMDFLLQLQERRLLVAAVAVAVAATTAPPHHLEVLAGAERVMVET